MTEPPAHRARSTVTVVGEALVDVVQPLDGPAVEHPGGSPANVALTLGRLGHPVHLLTRLGADERGERVAAHLASAGVRLLPGSTGDGPTTTAYATIGADGAASYEFELNCTLPDPAPPLPAGTACVHTGSFAALLPQNAATVLGVVHAARETATVSYDPNIRAALLGDAGVVRPQVEQLVAVADLVKLSDEDAHWLAPGTDPVELARHWLELGPALVVVTAGPRGAVAATRQGLVEIASRAVDLVDTVGAGDSFSAALVSAVDEVGLLGAARRDDLRAIDLATTDQVLDFAADVAAVTVSREGADPPWRDEVGG